MVKKYVFFLNKSMLCYKRDKTITVHPVLLYCVCVGVCEWVRACVCARTRVMCVATPDLQEVLIYGLTEAQMLLAPSLCFSSFHSRERPQLFEEIPHYGLSVPL